MKLNWKTRIRHKLFWVGLIGTICAPVFAYYGGSVESLNTWADVGRLALDALKNPYVLGSVVFGVLGFLGVLTDPTTEGLSDSERAMQYIAPGTLPEDAE